MYNLKVIRNLVISAFSSTKSAIRCLANDNENSKQAGLGYIHHAISLISTARVLYYSDKELTDRFSFDNLFICFDEIISSSLESHEENKLQQSPSNDISQKLNPLYDDFLKATE